jgi:hypothetical protein
MSGTALDHPLIRDYLRELDAAFSASPAGQARELREQIRPGQRQGYYIHLYNPSDWTQTVLGPADGSRLSPGSFMPSSICPCRNA